MSTTGPIDEIYLSCKSLLARLVSKIVPPSEIEDIVQETYVRACTFQSQQSIHNPRALMVKTARNLALDHVKRAEYRLAASLEDVEDDTLQLLGSRSATPQARAESDEEFAQFCEIVRMLPAQCRRVFVLKKVYGYSQREIAAELDLSESTVEKHIAKGMKHCARHFLQGQGSAGSTAAGSCRHTVEVGVKS